MQRKPPRRSTYDDRYAKVCEWSPSLFLSYEKLRGGAPFRRSLACIHFVGQLEEPVKGVAKLSGTIFPSKDVSIGGDVLPSVGSIIAIRNAVEVVLTVTEQEFSWIQTWAAGNLIDACQLSFTHPMRGKALITSFSFQTSPSPEDG